MQIFKLEQATKIFTTIFVIFTLFFNNGCYQDEFVGEIRTRETDTQWLYFFHQLLCNDSIEHCQIVGYAIVDNETISINRRCNVYDGYVEIATSSTLPQGNVFLSLWITLEPSDTLYTTIHEYKTLQTLNISKT